jgi:hypothetical protein
MKGEQAFIFLGRKGGRLTERFQLAVLSIF